MPDAAAAPVAPPTVVAPAPAPAPAAAVPPAAAPAVAPPVAPAPVVPAAPEAPAAPAVPTTYNFAIPEDAKAFVGEADQTRLAEVARFSGWTQDDLDGEVANIINDRKATHAALTAELTAHPELGGDKQAAAQQDIKRAIDFCLPPNTPERQRYDRDIARLALANYTPLVLAWARIGRAMGEDGRGGFTPGGPPDGQKTTIAKLFPSTPE